MPETSQSAVGAERAVPDCVTLPARAGVADAGLVPVEIYLGTEPAQFRATRAFIWSIEQVRNPARVYRVHVMSHLEGFDRQGWTTGFTNYRFAIPFFAGGQGRAIYCDEDQIFLTDPGELFDLELGEAGYLAISDSETSVMLIDCERMAEHWSLDDARHGRKKSILRRTLRVPGLRGALDPHWNARDAEYVQGVSHLLHYSTLHTQPWRPFPERFVYRTNRDAQLWHDLEDGAIEAGFEPFTAENPTCFFRVLMSDPMASDVDPPATPRVVQQAAAERIAELPGLAATGSVLELRSGRQPERPLPTSRWQVAGESEAGLLSMSGPACSQPSAAAHDGVIVTSGLEQIPPEDMPWVVEAIFRRARRFVFAAVPCQAPVSAPRGHPPVGTVRNRGWWVAHFETASRRHPEVSWQLALAEDGELAGEDYYFRSGGRFARPGSPRVWVLGDDRPGNTTQSIGLAEELGWDYEKILLDFVPSIYLPNPLLGASAHVLTRKSRKSLEPPWPDLVIAAGRRTAPVARWIARRSRGMTRIVQLGRKGANPAEPFDLAVSPAHARLSPHPNRLETAGALTRIRKKALDEAAVQWRYLFEPHASPRVALLVGGQSPHSRFDEEVAERLAREVGDMVRAVGGSLFVTTSRRTGDAAADAMERALPDAAHFHRWAPDQKSSENPMLGYLALADVLVVTGESESMLAEASAAGKSVQIYPLPSKQDGIFTRMAVSVIDWIVALAEREPRNNRGTTRPQQGLELLCSRLVAGGYVRPHRDLEGVQRAMVQRGLARMFDGSLEDLSNKGHSEIEDVVARVREMLGVPPSCQHESPDSHEARRTRDRPTN